MKLDTETPSHGGAFLDGLAVTILATLVLTPLATANLQLGLSAAAVASPAAVHSPACPVRSLTKGVDC